MPERSEPISFDANGVLTEIVVVRESEVIVHHDDVPDTDLTVVDGIPCTTALRTMIDIAPEVGPGEFDRRVRECLAGRLFTS